MANSYSAVFLTGNHGSTVPLYLQLSYFFFFLSLLVSLVIFVIGYVLTCFVSHDELLFKSLWA